MNPRIKELAEQSGLKVEAWMTNPPKPFQILGGTEQFEKFAELLEKEIEAKHFSAGYIAGRSDGIIEIVQKCVEIASEYDAPKMSGPGMIIAGRIESHFGVEE